MDLYVIITRNIQLGQGGGICRGCCFLLRLHFGEGLCCCDASTGLPWLPAPTPRRGGLSHPVPQHRAGEGTRVPETPPPGTPPPRAPSRTPRVFRQDKPRRWLLGSHQDVAFRTEDMAGKGNFGLTSLPSGRGPRMGICPAILPFLVTFFPTGTSLLVDGRLLQCCCPGGLSSCTLFICMAFNFLYGACVEKQRN